MGYKAHKSLLLSDKSYLSLIKKEIRQFAESLGFDKSKLGEIEIIVSEITSNLFKHASTGREILYKEVEREGLKGIELIAIDNGPGMHDSNYMLKDGVSTTGTLGQGLGAIQRLSHEFDLYSLPGWGSVLLSRYYLKRNEKTKDLKRDFDIKVVMVPKPGESACGDGCAFKKRTSGYAILAMDGLGHGKDAEAVSCSAAELFLHYKSESPTELLMHLHENLRKTRGGVGSILHIDMDKNSFSYCGIGNILTRHINYSKTRSMFSYNGVIGLNKPSQIHDQEGTTELRDIFVITSDGIKNRWDHSSYPGILTRDGSIFGAAIYKDQSRRTDDSMVIIVRLNPMQ